MPKTIFLIEDDPDILDIMYYLLSDTGYRVLKSDGQDALAQITISQPDLVLLDHRLQSGWGADICRQIKENEVTRQIRVVLVSATMHLHETAQSAGADGVLPKPFDMQELLDLVAGYLE